ncbi:MAG: coenzyme F420-0:L-glutamate ligase [Dermatophilaceae bacterium]|jgi:hypothetical protein|nr:coenzyme F420-0:L-glutamate ligase [Tetrasphaera sp.]
MAKQHELTIDIDGEQWDRIGIKTHLITILEPLDPIIEEQVKPQFQPGDFITISEKVVTISQGRVVHIDVVKASPLAKFIVKGVKKYDNDIGYSLPEKMQVAIYQAGYFRMIAALIGGTATRLFGRHGDFYRIAGNRISEIDGFNPDAMAPFDKFAMIGPGDPDGYAQRIEDAFGIPTVIIDGNNINVEVLGASKGLPVDRAKARRILLDNPMGQDDEMTPIMLCRKRP